MTERHKIEQLLRDLYAARVGGELEALCKLFSADARFKITGSSDGKPIAIAASGSGAVRSWLAMLVKTFRLTDPEIVSMVIDGARAAVHWRVNIHSKITGVAVPTELVDLIEVRDARIASYVEFFAPC
jgi:ketosteroid isomerase-like protein